MTDFQTLGLSAPLLEALSEADHHTPTPIQADAIPAILRGNDLLGVAQTGTGKTASFVLPILHRLLDNHHRPAARTCRVLILAPTRELATQIGGAIRLYGRHTPLRAAILFGGVPKAKQTALLAGGIDLVVATPGRLLDLLGDGALVLDAVEILVLDEADHMLDLGFIDDIARIVSLLPERRQTLLFSATMPPAIETLAGRLLHKPARVATAPAATPATAVQQRVVFVEAERKRAALLELVARGRIQRGIVFARTKQGADQIVAALDKAGIRASALHGDKSQPQRDRTLQSFRAGRFPILVATDVAARGLDIEGVTHIVNYDLPDIPEAYIHRIGRTGRAGAAGIAISLCEPRERLALRAIEKLLKTRIRVYEPRTAAA